MSTRVQWRRGNTAQTATFTGAVGEITVDTDKNVVVVHDGVTAGGFPGSTITLTQSSFDRANAGYTKANSAYSLAQGAFDSANNVAPQIEPAFTRANSAYAQANAGISLAQASFDAANNVMPQIQPSYNHANAAYDKANTAYTAGSDAYAFATVGNVQANSAYNKANSANVLAQSAFNTANTKFNTAGGTITGDITVQGRANVENRLSVGTGSYTVLPNLIAQFTGTSDYYSQINQQNLSGNGSGDIVVTADNGTDSANYIDMGIAGSTYDNTTPNAFAFNNPNDGYLMLVGDAGSSVGGNLFIGTGGSGSYSDISIIQGNDYTETARFVDGQGLVVNNNIEANNFTVNQYVDFVGSSTDPTLTQGRVWYNSTDHSLRAGTEHADVFVDLGKQTVTRVKNTSGVTITKGAAVYITGGEANDAPYVAMAKSDSYNTIDTLLGAARESIASGAYGYVVTSGPVTGVNTSMVTAGHVVYVSNATAGAYLDADIGPADGFAVHLGMCLVSDITNGVIQVALKGIEWGANFTNGSVAFSNGYRLFEDPTKFYYDYSNHRLGLGTDTPTATLHVAGNSYLNGDVTITGNLVAANISSVSTSELTVSGNTIYLSQGTAGTPVYNASIFVARGTSPNTYIRWAESLDKWVIFDGTDEGHILDSTMAFTSWSTYNSAVTYEKASYPIGADLAHDTFTLATGANTAAYAAQNTATSATTLAQAAFNKANTGGVQSVTANNSGRITQNGTTGNVTFDLATSGVSAGTYTYPSIQVDAYGRTVAISNQTPVTSFNGMTGAVTLSSANVVSALSYTPANKAGDNFTGAVIATALTSNTTVSLNGVGFAVSNTFTTASTAQVSVDSFATSTYRSAKYEVQMTSGTAYHVIELRVVHDGTTVWLNQYGEMFTGTTLGSFDASITSGTLNLLFTATNAVTTVKLIRRAIVV